MTLIRKVYKLFLLCFFMKYRSLFDFDKWSTPYMEWEGDVSGVLNYIEKRSRSFSYDHDIFKEQMVLFAPRLIRGVLDYKIDHLKMEGVVRVVQSATDTAMRIYLDPSSSSQHVDGFLNVLRETDNLDILRAEVSQSQDDTTWQYSAGSLSEKSAEYLATFFGGGDVFFLLAGHGGVMAGLDVSLRYKSITSNDNCIVYPMRFSTRKKNDSQPMSSDAENKYLLNASKGKNIVVFDEDVFSGATILGFKKFLRENLSIKRPIILKSNYMSCYCEKGLEQVIASEIG
jgi:hypothetical protein